MYLKRLEMQGFKSFADKIELEFNPGITVVVGPNGSGKSNIVDAIRWVLGEQSAKTLRGTRMDDIIFSGSDGRRAVGLAQVSLTIDNSLGVFPLEFNEVTVTRKLYRSGESEYLINKVPCRLRDIHELFMDTGVGREGFSVIGQGKIDEVLSLKAEDRRSLIEEAAGIVKYRYRKGEAQKKLEETEYSLLRLYDIVTELRDQLGPLREQADKASKYRQWKDEADQWAISLLLHNINESEQKLQEYTLQDRQLGDQLTVATTSYHSLQSKLERMQIEKQDLAGTISRLKQDYYLLTGKLKQEEQTIELSKERKNNFVSQLTRLENSCQEILNEEQKLTENLNCLASELTESRASELELAENIAELQNELSANKALLSSEERTIENKKNLLMDYLGVQAQNNNERTTLENNHQFAQKKQSTLIQKALEIDNLLIEEKKALDSLGRQEATLVAEKQQFDNQLDQLASFLEERQEELKKTNNIFEENKSEYQRLTSRLQALQEMDSSGEGYHKGVRTILAEKNKGSSYGHGIIGVVADIIQVPKDLEIAIEIALGGSLQYLITENDQIAQKAIEYLKTQRKGRATFLPLNTITNRTNNWLLEGVGVLGRASDLVSAEDKFQKVLEFLLGRIWVIEDMKQALALGKKEKFKTRMVTLSGELITAGGTITGGSYGQHNRGVLARKRLLAQLGKQAKLMKIELANEQMVLESLEKDVNSILQDMMEKKDQIYQLALQIPQVKSLQDQKKKDWQYLITEKELISLEDEQLKEQVQDFQQKMAQLTEQALQLKNKYTLLEKEICKLEENKKNMAMMQEKLSERLNQQKIKQATLIQRQQNTELRHTELSNRWARLSDNRQENMIEQNNCRQSIADLEKNILAAKAKISDCNSSLNQLNESLVKKKGQYSNRDAEILETEQHIKEQSGCMEKIGQQKHLQELNITKTNGELSKHLERLQEHFNLSFEDALPLAKELPNIKEAESKIRRLRKRLDDLGLVNFAAIGELERVSGRLEFLGEQIEDLQEAQENLTAVIHETDQVMMKRFKATYAQVNAAFSKVFLQLFDGGQAFLQLTDKHNLLETGLEIIAQPPGKNPQTLSLLSGGERAMTAIALLLAILKVKPSPFCVLDEIETSLDAHNALRFAEYLKSFADATQFIVITHRKDIMEIGDFLYGITMENSGVSKLISVKLNQAI